MQQNEAHVDFTGSECLEKGREQRVHGSANQADCNHTHVNYVSKCENHGLNAIANEDSVNDVSSASQVVTGNECNECRKEVLVQCQVQCRSDVP